MTLSRLALALAWMTSSLAAPAVQAAGATLMLRPPAASQNHLAGGFSQRFSPDIDVELDLAAVNRGEETAPAAATLGR